MRFSEVAVPLMVLAALLACKGKSSSRTSPSSAPSAALAEDPSSETPGKLADLTPSEIEARAGKAGFSVRSTDDSKADGMLLYELELENAENFAYVTLVDLDFDTKNEKLHAARLGETSGLLVHFEQPSGKHDAKKLLDEILAAKPLADLTRESLTEALKGLGYKSENVASDSEDGVTTVTISADKADLSVSVVFFDLGAAKRDSRLTIDGDRFMNVFVCQDCTKRKEGALKDVVHKTRARKLLARLTKPS